MQRFYITSPLTIDFVLTDEAIIHQLTRVLRVSLWEEIVLFDGDGSEYGYRIEAITKKSLSLRGIWRHFPHTETKKAITLYQALPNKLEKIEYILQKGVEVGIRRFIFFRSDFSQKLILSESKKSRLISIAREALEQCGGLVMPEIDFVDGPDALSFLRPIYEVKRSIEVPLGWIQESSNLKSMDSGTSPRWQKQWSQAKNIVLDTTGIVLKMQEMPQNDAVSLWVGPEGGWSPKEREKMKENGFIFARFGERVLRTETAGVVVAFALLHA